MSINIKSFDEFSKFKAEQDSIALENEQNSKREKNASVFKNLLSEYKVDSISSLSPEQKQEFYSRLEEGNAFLGARAKAITEDREEFEFNGKTYKVTEDHSDNPNDKYEVKPCEEEGTPWSVWEGDVQVKCFETKEEAEAYAQKQNQEQGLGEGNAFGDAVRKAKEAGEKEFEFQGKTYKVTESLTEAIQVEGKRDAKKVVTQYNKIFNKSLVDFGAMSTESILGCIKYLLVEALHDANFHKEAEATGSMIKGSIKPLEIKMPGLGGHFVKIGPKTIKEILDKYYSGVANAAGWGGIGIVEGTALYLEQIKQEAMGQAALNKFNSMFEGSEVRIDVEARINEAKVLEAAAWEIGKDYPSYGVVVAIKNDGDLCEVSFDSGENIVFRDTGSSWVQEAAVTEGRVKQFEMDLEDMIKDIKRGYGWIDPEFVADTWENTSDSIDFELVDAEIYKRLIAAGLLAYADENNEEAAGKKVKSLKELGIKESVVNEATSFKVGDKVEITKFIQDAEHDETGHLYDFNPGVKVEITNADKHSYQFKYLDKLPNERYWAFRKEFKANVIKESVVNEGVSKATQIYQIATPAPKAMLVEELENLFGDDYRHIVTEFDDDEGYESVLVFNLTKKDIQRIQNEIADVLIWEYSIKKGKEIIESVVTEGARIVLVDPDTNKQLKTVIFSGPNRDADKEVEKLNGKLTSSQKQKGLYWTITTYESVVNEAKFVKDFNRDVLKAKTKEEVLELYPNAEFFIGKSDHFFGELDDNLFFKAYYTKAQKEFEIKSVYSEKGSNYVHLYNESVVTEGKKVKVTKKDIEDIENSGNIDIAYKKAMAILTSLAESVVTEARYNKKSLLKKLGSQHDAIIQTGNGKEYIIYNPDSNNDDNAAMWRNDDSVFAVDQDGEEHEIKYSDIVSYNESVVNEAEIKSDDEFQEYAFTVLKKAFGDDFDEAKAQEVVDGILSKCGDDYGACVGTLTSSLG